MVNPLLKAFPDLVSDSKAVGFDAEKYQYIMTRGFLTHNFICDQNIDVKLQMMMYRGFDFENEVGEKTIAVEKASSTSVQK